MVKELTNVDREVGHMEAQRLINPIQRLMVKKYAKFMTVKNTR